MNKNKFYSIIIIGLLLSNIVLIGFMVMPKHGKKGGKDGPNRGSKGGAKEIVVERLQFSPKQTASYVELIAAHKDSVRSKDQKLKDLKQALFNELKNDQTLKKDTLLYELAIVHVEIEELHFNHFKDIKALCNSDQLGAFDAMVDDIGKIFRPKRRR